MSLEDKMEKELLDKFKAYERGTIIDLIWERLNGELTRQYVYYGLDSDNNPLLVDYMYLEKRPVIFFDVSNPEIRITKIEKVLSS